MSRFKICECSRKSIEKSPSLYPLKTDKYEALQQDIISQIRNASLLTAIYIKRLLFPKKESEMA